MTDIKVHAACDECRKRKLKCSGEASGCARCRRESLKCVYSPQAPMGRPKKRQRQDDEIQPETVPSTTNESDWLDPRHLNGPVSTNGVALYSNGAGLSDFEATLHDPIFNAPTPQDLQALDKLSESLGFEALTSQDSSSRQSSVGDVSSNTSVEMPPQAVYGDYQPNPFTSDGKLSCLCLTNMVRATTSMEQCDSNLGFPITLAPLRQSVYTAHDILNCAVCPAKRTSRQQNTFMLLTLLSALACKFDQLLRDINTQAAQMRATGQKKPFRMGDSSAHLAHLHTGNLECPLGFNIDLEADEWHLLARKATMREVENSSSGATTLVSLLEALEKRQIVWHESDPAWQCANAHFDRKSSSCVQLTQNIRNMLANLPA